MVQYSRRTGKVYFSPGEKLLMELNSEAFVRGVESCIEFTQNEGLESGFVVWGDGKGRFVYPDQFATGSPSSVNPQSMNGPKYPDFEEVANRGRNPYKIMYNEKTHLAEVLHIHTHPSGRVVPSLNDLKYLHQARYSNPLRINPLGITIGTVLPPKSYLKRFGTFVNQRGLAPINTRGYPLLFIQEKPENRLSLETDFGEVRNAFEKSVYDSVLRNEAEHHNFLEGEFDPDERAIRGVKHYKEPDWDQFRIFVQSK